MKRIFLVLLIVCFFLSACQTKNIKEAENSIHLEYAKQIIINIYGNKDYIYEQADNQLIGTVEDAEILYGDLSFYKVYDGGKYFCTVAANANTLKNGIKMNQSNTFKQVRIINNDKYEITDIDM
ncbi:MAG: hypothetical protein PHH84_02140 [Oscillospiraceae bacterium]|nr:hypothetical protein [Oscillospiraceae bacterium]